MRNGTSWFILQNAQQNQHEIWIHSIAWHQKQRGNATRLFSIDIE
jgi:hypothetical protein